MRLRFSSSQFSIFPPFSFLFVVVAPILGPHAELPFWTLFLDPIVWTSIWDPSFGPLFGPGFWIPFQAPIRTPFWKMLTNGLRRAPAPIWAPGHLKCQSKTVLERPVGGAPKNQGPQKSGPPRAHLGHRPSKVSKKNCLGATIWGSPPKSGTPFWTPFLDPCLDPISGPHVGHHV